MLLERPMTYAALGVGAALILPEWSALQAGTGTHSPTALLIGGLFGAVAVFLGGRLAQAQSAPRARHWRLFLWGVVTAGFAGALLLAAVQVAPRWERAAIGGAALLVALAFLGALRR